MKKTLSRKEFFRTAGKITVGAAAGITGLQMLNGSKTFAKGADAVPWPWPYEKLDPEYVRKLGHDSFWQKACCYGAFNAIIQALREKVGSPFDQLPTEMMIYGHGGVSGWGTICGALNGASAAICLVCDKPTADAVITELVGWYTQTALPTDKSNQYGKNQEYGDNRYTEELPQSVSDSPLCHASVSQWVGTAGKGVHTLERKERCGRLAGDVAAKAVELLNAVKDGTFQPVFTPAQSVVDCMACHGKSVKDNVLSKMDCTPCHGNPHAQTSSVEQVSGVAFSYKLGQNYPNPFNPSTTIEFSLPRRENVTLSIYDVNGRLVRNLIVNEPYAPGVYRVDWDGLNEKGEKVASGVYFYRIQAGRFRESRKMTFNR